MQIVWSVKNKLLAKRRAVLLCGVLLCCLLFGGCRLLKEYAFFSVGSENVGALKDKNESVFYPVVVVDSLFYQVEEPAGMVPKNENITFFLNYEPGFTFASCDYATYRVQETEEGVFLTLEDVNAPTRVYVTSQKKKPDPEPARIVTLTYDANGGIWTGNREDPRGLQSQTVTLTTHIRPNTLNGNGLTREGYTLTGWNTKADGSGTHVGLGSRTDTNIGILYAEWAAWTDPSYFTYRRNENGVILTGYKGPGSLDSLVIPARLDGLAVTEIAGSFTTNMPCKSLQAKALILPDGVREVESSAFSMAEFEELFFFDSLTMMGERAFFTPVRTVHIQAAMPPVYQKNNANAAFADKLDRLMLAQGKKKLALFAGCSLSYGLDSSLVEASFPDYEVFNLGVIGGISARFQMDIIERFLEPGDTFVHAPEEMSGGQLYFDISCDYRMFIMVEGNYDLLSLADLSYGEDLWKAYNMYVKMKSEEEPGSYEDFSLDYNHYGDILLPRPFEEDNAEKRDVSYNNGEYVFSCEYLTDRAMDRLCGMYDSLKEKGINVLISYAPVNLDGLADLDGAIEFEKRFTAMLKERGWQPVSRLEDYLFQGRYFYDSDYHLNEYGALLRTRILISDLFDIL